MDFKKILQSEWKEDDHCFLTTVGMETNLCKLKKIKLGITKLARFSVMEPEPVPSIFFTNVQLCPYFIKGNGDKYSLSCE